MSNSLNEKEVLREIYKNSSMAVESIEAILSKVYDEDLAYDLNKQLHKFKDIALKSETRLNEMGQKPIHDDLIGKAMLWASIQMNTLMNISTSHIADLLIKGNKRGVGDMLKSSKKNKDCGAYATELANELVDFEVENIERLKGYKK